MSDEVRQPWRFKPRQHGDKWEIEDLYTAEQLKAAVLAERERCANLADAHECGGPDDITCQGQNCGMLISAAIRKGEE